MCILFLYMNDNEYECPYRLVVANNRDEFWDRPTATAEFRGDNQKWIGGIDLVPGRKGETWLGLSKTGRFAVLLNVQEDLKRKMRGRGHLVRDFVEGTESCEEFLKPVSAGIKAYNNFHYVCSDLRLVVANNRDEFWDRPTATAEFRGDNQKWIGGIDLVPGRKGGTWLGLSKTGRFAVLLNVQEDLKRKMRGRGHLVRDFVEGTESCEEFLKPVSAGIKAYNNFHYVCSDLSIDPSYIHYISSKAHGNPGILPAGFHSFDNSYCKEMRYKKTHAGEKKFKMVVKDKSLTHQEIVDRLLGMLNNKTQYYPDSRLADQFGETYDSSYIEELKQRSALCVWSPAIRYGTRTNTVILVDFDGNCDYYERTLDTPVNPENPTCSLLSYSFKIDEPS